MIGAGAITVKEWKLRGLSVDRDNTRTISNKSDLKEHACTIATVKDTDCEKLIDEKIPDNDDGLKLGAEAARVAGRDAYRTKQPGATNAVNRFKTILGTPESWRAGTPFRLDRRTTRTLFGDTDSYVKTGTALGGTNITAGTTTLAAALQAAKGPTPPPPPAGKPVAASPAEFDADGNRKKSEVAPKEEPQPLGLTVGAGFAFPLSDLADKLGLRFSLEGKSDLYRSPKTQVYWEGSYLLERGFENPSDPHYALGGVSEGGFSYESHLHALLGALIALNGHKIDLPKVNVLATNDIANQLEKLMVDRWGEKAARIYLNSVVYPHMAKAKDLNAMKAAWELVVTKGAKVFEDTLKDPKSTPAVDLTIVKLFEQDPNGLIDLLALLSGETEQAASQKAFKDVKTFASVGPSKYELPKDAQGRALTSANPAEFKPANPTNGQPMWELLAIVDKDKLVAKAEEWKKAMGKDDAKLKAIADRNKVANPFEKEKIPNNPWAAQKLYNDFLAAAGEELKAHGEASWVLALRAGLLDLSRLSGEASAAAEIGVAYQPSKNFKWSLKVAGSPAAKTEPIAQDPQLAGGSAYAVGTALMWKFLESKTGWYRGGKLDLEATYSDGTELAEYIVLYGAHTSTFGITKKLKLEVSATGRNGWDLEGGADKLMLATGGKFIYGPLELGYAFTHKQERDAISHPSGGLDDGVGLNPADRALAYEVGPTTPKHKVEGGYKIGNFKAKAAFGYGATENYWGNGNGSASEKTGTDKRVEISGEWEL